MALRKIILAPDSYKETLSAAHVARAMAEGIVRVSSSIVIDECPIGDGGEGTMEAIVHAGNGRFMRERVAGPFGDAIEARYGLIHEGATGVIELALASGLALVPPAQRNPMRTTTFGTGELIMRAINAGCEEIIVCIGGSATVDGGTGIAQACGWRFLDHAGVAISEYMRGDQLRSIGEIQPPECGCKGVRVACDVTNPLLGPNGAATVYGPQKGATPDQVRLLEDGLSHLALIAGGDPDSPGAGAAGGAGFGLATFLGGRLERGIELALQAVGFRERCRGADLVLTGEGRLDAQSLLGKACMGVASAAGRMRIPTIAIVGSTDPGAGACVSPDALTAYHSLADRFGEDRARRETHALIADVTEQVVRDLHA